MNFSQVSTPGDNTTAHSADVRDLIRVKNLSLTVSFTDGSRWPSNEPAVQPVVITLAIAHDLRQTAQTDDLSHSINYSGIVSSIRKAIDGTSFPSVEALADLVCESCLTLHSHIQDIFVRISRPKALLYACAAGIELSRHRIGKAPLEETFFIEDLECHAIIGVNPCEREERQRVRFNIWLTREASRKSPFDFRNLTRKVVDNIQVSTYLTLEALASSVAQVVLHYTAADSDRVTLKAAKPSALILAESAEVEVTRTLKDYQPVPTESDGSPSTTVSPSSLPVLSSKDDTKTSGNSSQDRNAQIAEPAPSSLTALLATLPRNSKTDSPMSYPHKATIALGANIGDRFANIERALRLIESPGADLQQGNGVPKVVIVDTSFMYETSPMYVTDQPKFINCACMVDTNLEPRELLTFLKDIENAVGRVSSFRNGPRAIDLDILTFDSTILDTRPESERGTLDNLAGQLVVPHPRIAEREFVLRPLNDMIPEYILPTLGKSVETLFKELILSQSTDTPPMSKVVPFPRYPLPTASGAHSSASRIPPVPPTSTYWSFPIASSTGSQRPRKTYMMGTLNATPDSFSDGSAHDTLPEALAYATSAVAAGADIIDIGGYSTRPGADYVSPEEEFSRVIPVVQAIRGLWQEGSGPGTVSQARNVKTAAALISVDTFRWEVAEEAVHAGANCINDVYAFTGPEYPLTQASAEHFVKMRQVARDLAVPVVLMHSRGEASANKDYSMYTYATDARGRGSVLEGVRVELGEKVDAAVKGPGGLRRWFVIVDPGVGFSKSVDGNLELLRASAEIVADSPPSRQGSVHSASLTYRNPLAGYQQLIGTSRKSFLGMILAQSDLAGSYEGRQTKPDEREWATATAVSCAVQQNAAVVRVHDVSNMGDVVRVASALWG